MANEESSNASAPDAFEQPEVTQSVPGYQPPPPGVPPGDPSWMTQQREVPRPRTREAAVLGVSIGVSLALVLGLPAAVVTLTPVGEWIGYTAQQAQQAPAAVQAAAQGPAAPAAPAAGDLREGGVFLMSNSDRGNVVLAYSRGQDGRLTEVGRYETGGLGSGSFEDTAGALALGTSEGEASPNQVVDKAELLFVPNAGSSSITVFRVLADRLELASKVSSGGEKPVSLTVSKGVLYVLNSGEFDDRLLLSETEAIENCTTGQLPSVTGFKVSPDGNLTPIEGSTRLLSEEAESGCAQVSFSPDGTRLVVSERIANIEGTSEPNKGALVTFTVRSDGTLSNKKVLDPIGIGPFGFTFTSDGKLLTTQQTRALANPGGGHVASYTPGPDNAWMPTNGSVPNFQTDTCWIQVTKDGRLAFVSAPFPGTVGSYSLGTDGSMTLIKTAAGAPDGVDQNADPFNDATTDIGLSRDNQFLYVLNSNEGVVVATRVNPDGTLTHIESYQAFEQLVLGEGGELDAYGLVAF